MRAAPVLLLMISATLVACDTSEPPAAPTAPAAPAAVATTLVTGATIHTMNPEMPVARVMVFDGSGRIRAVGDDSLLEQYADAGRLELPGKTIIPGLIDAHGHLGNLALLYTQVNLVGAASKQETLDRLEQFAAGLEPGEWLLGRGWDQNDWEQQVFPTRADLDQLFPDRPVWLRRVDGHAAWANSVAMAQADRDFSGDWQPQGGQIIRDDAGQPTGIFIDGAMSFIGELAPEPGEALIDAALDRALEDLAAVGITGVHDAGTSRVQAERYLRRIEQGRFDLRVYGMADGLREAAKWICGQPITHPSGRFVMRSVKLYADGALGSRGAALEEAYSDDPGNVGLLFHEPDAFELQLSEVMGCGLQAAVHAIGDRGNRVILDTYQQLADEFPHNPGRHRIEHVQVLRRNDVPRFAELDVIASVQPTHATSDMYWAEDRLGPERVRFAYAWRSLLDAGARLALGSDFVVESIDPRLGLQAAVTRQDLEGFPEGGWYHEQALDISEALRGFTLDAAYAGFMENEVGSLEPGKRADFVVLSDDPLQLEADDLHQLGIESTWLDGHRIWSLQQADDAETP